MRKGKTRLISFSLLGLALAMAGCSSSEELLTEQPASDQKTMYAFGKRNAGDASSRTSYEEGDEAMTIKWSAGDAFSVFKGRDEQTPWKFTIIPPANGVYSANEKFECQGGDFTGVKVGDVLDAIYPALPDGNTHNPRFLEFDIFTQTQIGSGNTEHIKNNDYIVGHATYTGTNILSFDFTDAGNGNAGCVGTIFRLDMKFSDQVSKVTKIEISTTNNTLNTRTTINLAGNSTFLYTNPGTVRLNIIEGTTVTAETNRTFRAYAILLPSKLQSGDKLKVVTTTNAGIYTQEVNVGTSFVLERGFRNFTTLDLIAATPDRTSLTAYNAVGSGTAADPYLLYTEAQLKDWATQNNAGSIVVKTNSRAATAYAHFKLANDITLTAPADGGSNWTPVGTDANPFVGIFDGNNKTLSAMTVNTTNTTYAGFIGRMTGGELKNLTVKGTVTADNTETDNTNKIFAAGLVASMEGGMLSGTLTSDVVVTAKGNASVYAGGLVGAKKDVVTVSEGAKLSATGAVTATISSTGTVAGSEIGAGSIIGNGTKDENTATGAGTVTVTAPDGTTIVNNGVSNKVNPGDVTTSPWEPNGGSDLETK